MSASKEKAIALGPTQSSRLVNEVAGLAYRKIKLGEKKLPSFPMLHLGKEVKLNGGQIDIPIRVVIFPSEFRFFRFEADLRFGKESRKRTIYPPLYTKTATERLENNSGGRFKKEDGDGDKSLKIFYLHEEGKNERLTIEYFGRLGETPALINNRYVSLITIASEVYEGTPMSQEEFTRVFKDYIEPVPYIATQLVQYVQSKGKDTWGR